MRYLNAYGITSQDFRPQSTIIEVPAPPPPPGESPLLCFYHCTVQLPPQCPITMATSPGPGFRRKDLAKRHASLEMIRQLNSMGEIDDWLLPTPKRNLAGGSVSTTQLTNPGPQADSQAVGTTTPPSGGSAGPNVATRVRGGFDTHRTLTRAFLWDDLPPFTPDNLYTTMVELQFNGPNKRRVAECRKICLFTTKPLPIVSETTLNIETPQSAAREIGASAHFKPMKKLKNINEDMLNDIMAYNIFLLRAQTNKALQADLGSTKWLVVPLRRDYRPSEKIFRGSIDWEEIKEPLSSRYRPFTIDDIGTLEKEVVDSVATLKNEFARRVAIMELRTDLSPHSPHPDQPGKTIHESLAVQGRLTYPDQPIFVGNQLPPAKSGGYLASLSNANRNSQMHLPELAVRHFASASMLRTTSTLPFVMGALDDYLVAGQLVSEKMPKMSIPLVVQALSCPSNSVEARRSYERLEFLGDTLLKFLVVTYLVVMSNHEDDWARLNTNKDAMLTNKSLQTRLTEAGIVRYLRSYAPKVQDWVPYGWTLEEGAQGPGPKHLPLFIDQRPGEKVEWHFPLLAID